MKRNSFHVLWLLMTAGCVSEPAQYPLETLEFYQAELAPEEPQHVVEIVETPIPLPLPGQLKNLVDAPEQESVSPARAIEQGREAARVEPSIDGYSNAIQVYPYTEGALYQLYASPGQVSDIALQPGEILTSVSAGDTVRWIVGDTVSGNGDDLRAHVLVKPTKSGLSTNLMIATNRRTYHLELTSLESGYMAALSWRYAADELAKLTMQRDIAQTRSEAQIASGLSLEDLNFNYRIEGDVPPWRPLRVFDDGRQVFIQMPAGFEAMEAPPLFILGAGNKVELVNYRVRGGYYIVDHLFTAAELRLGDAPQSIVRIRKGADPTDREAHWRRKS
ncbi:MAG: P-type conjugative transfer protein TrbG [Hyphomonas sp.]|nr:P-type conjugative transfer protein TrbG [Nitrospira sp.]